MSESGPTWLLMIRDVSKTVRIADQPCVMVSVIVDADTGLVRAVTMADTVGQACAQAVDAALSRAAGPLPPGPPARIVHHEDTASAVAEALTRARLRTPPTMVVLDEPLGEAEDVFDSLLGHLAGRSQPSDPPTGRDWRDLYAQAARFCRAEPWQRWSDAQPFDLQVTTPDSVCGYLAVVLGQAGIQRGLAVYPGGSIPDPRDGPAAPSGSLLFWLDPPDEVPEEFAAKAHRYDWPHELPFVPLPLTVTDEGSSDLGRVTAHHLTLALAAVVQLDGSGSRRITGRLPLDEDAIGSYTIGPSG